MPDLFLKIISREIPAHIIYENDTTLAFLALQPNTKGHTLVIPKNYSRNMLDISEGDLLEVMKTVRLIAPQIIKAVGAEGFCIGQNNEAVAGQVIFHTHFHIIPRFTNDGLVHWHGHDVSQETLADNAEIIKQEIKWQIRQK